MMDSPRSSMQPSLNNTPERMSPRTKIYVALFFIVSLLGFTDSTYLAIKKLTGSPVTCTIVHGCETVTSSVYSEIFGIPVALLGSFFYLTILLVTVLYIDRKQEHILRRAAHLTWIGLGASAYFIFVQAVLLQAWCIYCIGSAISSSLLFVVGMTYLRRYRPAART